MIDYQVLFNIVFGVASLLAGWFFKIVKSNYDDLKEEQRSASDKISTLQVLVAGEYARRIDVEKLGDSVLAAIAKTENLQVKAGEKSETLQTRAIETLRQNMNSRLDRAETAANSREAHLERKIQECSTKHNLRKNNG